jgi:predicted nucleic acid-binding protein
MSGTLYLDSSMVLRAVLERGVAPAIGLRVAEAGHLVTSRLSLVETARAFGRLRQDGVAESLLADAAHEADELWSRCAVWELTAEICELAAVLAARHPHRTVDALHLATFLTARRKLGDVALLTADPRLEAAATAV